MPATERRRSTSLHARCNRALELRNRIRALALTGAPLSLTSGAVVALMKNAEDLRHLMGVYDCEPILPADRRGSMLHVDRITLPNSWTSRLNDLVEREPNLETRRVVRSKVAYAKWNLNFAILIASLEHTLGSLVLPLERDSAQPSVYKAAAAQRGDRTSSGAKALNCRGVTDPVRSAMNGIVTAAPRPEEPADADQNGRAFRTGPEPYKPPVAMVQPAMDIIEEASSITLADRTAESTPAERALSSPRMTSGRVIADADGGPPSMLQPASGDAPVIRSPAGGEAAKENRGRDVQGGSLDPMGIATATSGPARAAGTSQNALPLASDTYATSSTAPDVVEPEAAHVERIGRILFDPPEGKGLCRTVNGVEFSFNPAADAWMDETETQHRARADRAIERFLSAAPQDASQPWHPYLSVAASLEISRLLATTILGGYTQVTGRGLDQVQFEVSAAAPLEQLGLRRMLEKMILVLWEGTPWYEKVTAKKPSEALQTGPALWETIGSNHRVFDKALANWIVVETQDAEISASCDDGGGEGEDGLECVINPETGDPLSRFADVAAAIESRSLPKPDYKLTDKVYAQVDKSPIHTEPSILLLGIGGTGKTYLINCHLEWLRGRYSNTKIFSFNASCAGLKKAFRTIIREMAMAEADGAFCIFVCDEVQHLSAPDFERLGTCAAVVLAGDVRQSGSGERVHPVIPFARRTGAKLVDMTQVWRASNTSLLNQISYTFYDSAFTALGRGDGILEPPIFKYDLCVNDVEVIAAHCWVAARTLRATNRSLMLIIERDDISEMIVKMAGSDRRQWTKGGGFVQVLKPFQIQGREADVVMFLPNEFSIPEEKPAYTMRRFITLMGRARQEIWMLFTQKSIPNTSSERVFASLLRSFLESKVTTVGFPSKVKLPALYERFLSDLGLTNHSMGRWQLLAYRGRAVALYEDYARVACEGGDPELHAFGKLHDWPVLSIVANGAETCEFRSAHWSDKPHDEIQKRKDNIDRQLGSDRNQLAIVEENALHN